MTAAPSTGPGRTMVSRRLAGVLIGFAAEAVLLGALAVAAWGSWQNEARDPLSFDEGLSGLVFFGGAGSLFVIAAAACIACTKRRSTDALATMLLLVAGFIGFVGFALTSLSRQELSDC